MKWLSSCTCVFVLFFPHCFDYHLQWNWLFLNSCKWSSSTRLCTVLARDCYSNCVYSVFEEQLAVIRQLHETTSLMSWLCTCVSSLWSLWSRVHRHQTAFLNQRANCLTIGARLFRAKGFKKKKKKKKPSDTGVFNVWSVVPWGVSSLFLGVYER